MSILKQFQLNGHTALVTGSARGIGKAIALGLAECGATVAVHGINSSPLLDDTLTEVRRFAPRSAAVIGDLTELGAAGRIVADATAVVGALDIVVINASIQVRKSWEQITPEEALQQMQANFHASLQLIQAAVPTMRVKNWGRILTIGSVQQQRPHPDMAVYAASKSALENLVRNLAKQLGPDGITVNNLAPGVIRTDRNAAALADETYAARVREAIPLRYFAVPDECVGAALLLCSEAGRYITGMDQLVDGGIHLS